MKAIAVLGAILMAATAFAGETADVPRVFNASKASWMAFGDPKAGPWVSVISGNPQQGPNDVFLKTKGNSQSGWHTHDADYTGVVIEGEVTHQDQNGPELKLKAGEAWTSKAGVNHLNRCLTKKDCVVFISMAGKASYNPMSADGKPVQPPPPAKTN